MSAISNWSCSLSFPLSRRGSSASKKCPTSIRMNALRWKIFATTFFANLFAILLMKWSTRKSCLFFGQQEKRKVFLVMKECGATKIVIMYDIPCFLSPTMHHYIVLLLFCWWNPNSFRAWNVFSSKLYLHHSISINFANWSIKLFRMYANRSTRLAFIHSNYIDTYSKFHWWNCMFCHWLVYFG